MSRYDQDRFDPAPDPDLVCCICQAVLDCPLETPCRHVFCRICIERWLGNHQTCPSCRKHTQKEDLRPVLPIIQNMVHRLQIRCRNFEHGCTKTILLENIESHEKECGYEQLQCRYMQCRAVVLRREKLQHEDVECEHREIQCKKGCDLFISFRDVESHDCLRTLKAKLAEQTRNVECLKEENENLKQQNSSIQSRLDATVTRLHRMHDDIIDHFSSSSSNVNDDNASSRTWNTEYTLGGLEEGSVASNNTDVSLVIDDDVFPPTHSPDGGESANEARSSDGNEQMIIFSSNAGPGVRVHGNASVRYASHQSESSGSETSGFIAESSGYDRSPTSDRQLFELDRGFGDSDAESYTVDTNHEERPSNPEPPNSECDGTEPLLPITPASSIQSHYSLNHTPSDSDAADAVRDVLDHSFSQRSRSISPSLSSHPDNSNVYSLSSSGPCGQITNDDDDDDLRGFSSSDDLSDRVDSDDEKQVSTRWNESFSFSDLSGDNNDEVDTNVLPSRSLCTLGDKTNSYGNESNEFLREKRRLTNIEGSGEVSDHHVINGNVVDGDSVSNIEKLAYASSIDDALDQLQRDMASPQHSQYSRSSNRSHGSTDNQDTVNRITGFSDIDDQADDSILCDFVGKPEDNIEEKELNSSEDENSSCSIRNDSESRTKLPSQNSKSSECRATAFTIYNDTDNLGNREDLTQSNCNSKRPSEVSSVDNNISKKEVENDPMESDQIPSCVSGVSSPRLSESRKYRTRSTKPALPVTSRREQDKSLELLEESYELRRENKQLDTARFVSHVQKMMSCRSGTVHSAEAIVKPVRGDTISGKVSKRKCEQQEDDNTMDKGTKRIKRETGEKVEKSQRSKAADVSKIKTSHRSCSTRTETVTCHSSISSPSQLGEVQTRYRSSVTDMSNISVTGSGQSTIKIGDRKHTWDPKNLNISLNVAINLDKTGRSREQCVSASKALGGTSSFQNSEKSATQPVRITEPVPHKHEGKHQQVVDAEKRKTGQGCTDVSCKKERQNNATHNKACSLGRTTNKSSSSQPTESTRQARFAQGTGSFTTQDLNEFDSTSDEDADWEPKSDESSDISISSSEIEMEENMDYKLKIPIPTATLLEKYKDCDDSDDSWSPV